MRLSFSTLRSQCRRTLKINWFNKLLILAFFISVAAQPVMARDYRVKAALKDSLGEAMEFVTWRVFSARADSVSKAMMAKVPKGVTLPPEALAKMAPKPETSGITGIDGLISAALKTPGKYRLAITSTEINPQDIEFEVDDTAPVADLGTITPSDRSRELGEVVVTAQKPLVVKEIDRIGYDVQADVESKTSMLDQILRKVPMVTVDPDGTIRVNGSTSFKIYKNGRPNKGFTSNAKDIFKSIPASSIKKIEVITDPGSREDADSGMAILNIVTDSETALKGVTGSVGLRTDTRDPLPMPNLFLTTQINKLTMSLYGGMWRRSKKHSQSHSEGIDRILSSGITRESESWSQSSNMGGYGGLELSLELDTLNLITAEMFMHSWSSKNWSDGTTRQFDAEGNPMYSYSYRTKSPGKNSDLNIDGSLNYQRSTRLKGETITLSYMISNGSNNSRSDREYYDLVNAPMGYDGMYSKVRQKSLEHTFQFDWSRPLNNKIKFDAGAKYIYRDNNSRNTLEYSGMPEMDARDRFNHNTNIGAIYTDWRGKWGKFGARAGVRYEFSRMSRKYHSSEKEDYHSDFNDWVPNVAVSYDFTDASTLKLTYGRRITRPSIDALDPTIITTPTTVSGGNPDLKSSYYNNYSLEWNLNKMKFNTRISVSYSTSDDGFLNVETVKDDILYSTWNNKMKSRQLSVSAFFQYKPSFNTMVYFNGGWSLSRMEDPTRDIHLTRPNFNAQLFARQKLPWNLYVMGGVGIYTGWGSSLYSYSKLLNSGVWNFLGLQKSLLKDDRLNIGIQASNPFGPYKHVKSATYRVRGDMRGTSYDYQKNNCTVMLHINYRFGSLKAFVKKVGRGISNDDVQKTSSGEGNQGGAQGGM